ncbi:MAG: TonB-dependent receptor [Rhizomicrobium sp.]
MSSAYRSRKIGLAAGLGFLLSSTSVLAQAAPVSTVAPSDSTAAGGLEQVIVTAQRHAEDLQKVPLAVSAFTSHDLADRQITNALDLVQYVPNLIGHNNTALGTANTYSMRGLNNTESISTFDVPVGTYIDDIYLSRQGANNFSMFDVDQIEVLRGPQGTLFGRNTTGGAINVILKKPGDQLTGFLEAGYGAYNRTQVRGSVDVPLADGDILTKVSGYYTNADGYVHNQTTGQLENGDREWGGRVAVRLPLDANSTWDLAANYTYANNSNLVNFYDPKKGERVDYTPFFTNKAIGAALVSAGLADNTLGDTTKTYTISSNFETVVAGATVNFITGYLSTDLDYMTDSFDGLSSASVVLNGVDFVSGSRGYSTPLVNDSWSHQFTQEIKVTGSGFHDFLTYVAGVYYLNERNWTNFANITVPLTGPSLVSADRVMTNGTESYAAYFQGDFHITSDLTFTAGARWTHEAKDVEYQPNPNPLARSSAANQPFSTQDVVNLGIPVKMNADVLTPRFALNYQITPDVMAFASATRGFKSGGWNARAYDAGNVLPFNKETIWSYEGGVRSEWWDNRVRANLTGFYYVDADNQLPAGYVDPKTGLISYLIRNYADLADYGVEGDFTVEPIDGFNIFWDVGTQSARFQNIAASVVTQIANCKKGITANNCNAGIVTPAGTIADPTRAPSFTSTLGTNYTFLLGSDYSLTPNVAWNYVAGTWVSTSNDPKGYQPGHSLFNAGLTLRDEVNHWSLTGECNNCFDDTYKTSFLIYPYLNDPGTWMIRARYDY